ncbi:MAG TPA: hypothetical protein VM818_07520 [Vicinamibacterales bacterium]|jgi:hypothetical protein|nr:hypothetical protein [Vicinamibacterales bacterium]
MKNRAAYADFNMVFAKQPEHLYTPGARLGEPCLTLSRQAFARLITTSGVKRIVFHGTRHRRRRYCCKRAFRSMWWPNGWGTPTSR